MSSLWFQSYQREQSEKNILRKIEAKYGKLSWQEYDFLVRTKMTTRRKAFLLLISQKRVIRIAAWRNFFLVEKEGHKKLLVGVGCTVGLDKLLHKTSMMRPLNVIWALIKQILVRWVT